MDRSFYRFVTIHACDRRTDGRTDRRTEFSSLDCVCIPCSAVKIQDSCINSATDRGSGYVLERMFTKFSEITQCNGHYAVQGHSRSPILVPIESSYTTFY